MLYALLVEGHGPLGSVFSRDDFTDKEVQDTDSDGLPEFVDAWGQPLQFYRWPLLYHSDIQRGQVDRRRHASGPSTAGLLTWTPYALRVSKPASRTRSTPTSSSGAGLVVRRRQYVGVPATIGHELQCNVSDAQHGVMAFE